MIWKEGVTDAGLDPEFLRHLRRAEEKAGFDFIVTDAYREGDKKCHGRGKAVDLRVSYSGERFRILEALLWAGFRRIGIYDLHIHADRCSDMPNKVLWLGKSR